MRRTDALPPEGDPRLDAGRVSTPPRRASLEAAAAQRQSSGAPRAKPLRLVGQTHRRRCPRRPAPPRSGHRMEQGEGARRVPAELPPGSRSAPSEAAARPRAPGGAPLTDRRRCSRGTWCPRPPPPGRASHLHTRRLRRGPASCRGPASPGPPWVNTRSQHQGRAAGEKTGDAASGLPRPPAGPPPRGRAGPALLRSRSDGAAPRVARAGGDAARVTGGRPFPPPAHWAP